MSSLARKLVAQNVASVDIEHRWKRAKATLSKRRNRMKQEKFESVTVLQSCYDFLDRVRVNRARIADYVQQPYNPVEEAVPEEMKFDAREKFDIIN